MTTPGQQGEQCGKRPVGWGSPRPAQRFLHLHSISPHHSGRGTLRTRQSSPAWDTRQREPLFCRLIAGPSVFPAAHPHRHVSSLHGSWSPLPLPPFRDAGSLKRRSTVWQGWQGWLSPALLPAPGGGPWGAVSVARAPNRHTCCHSVSVAPGGVSFSCAVLSPHLQSPARGGLPPHGGKSDPQPEGVLAALSWQLSLVTAPVTLCPHTTSEFGPAWTGPGSAVAQGLPTLGPSHAAMGRTPGSGPMGRDAGADLLCVCVHQVEGRGLHRRPLYSGSSARV